LVIEPEGLAKETKSRTMSGGKVARQTTGWGDVTGAKEEATVAVATEAERAADEGGDTRTALETVEVTGAKEEATVAVATEAERAADEGGDTRTALVTVEGAPESREELGASTGGSWEAVGSAELLGEKASRGEARRSAARPGKGAGDNPRSGTARGMAVGLGNQTPPAA
jgi:hypothetical protein